GSSVRIDGSTTPHALGGCDVLGGGIAAAVGGTTRSFPPPQATVEVAQMTLTVDLIANARPCMETPSTKRGCIHRARDPRSVPVTGRSACHLGGPGRGRHAECRWIGSCDRGNARRRMSL